MFMISSGVWCLSLELADLILFSGLQMEKGKALGPQEGLQEPTMKKYGRQ